MRNSRKRFQSPYIPLVLMIVIMMGYIVGKRNQQLPEESTPASTQVEANGVVDGDENISNTPEDNQNIANLPYESEDVDGTNESNQQPTASVDPEQPQEEASNPSNEDESQNVIDDRSDAEIALDSGLHIKNEVDDEYTMSVAKDYCDRKVVECSSESIIRSNDRNMYHQHFEDMSGYMNLVKLSSSGDTIFQGKVSTEIENITAILVFPDQSYIILEANEDIQFILPKGDSMMLYIGKNITGDIEINIKENKCISSRRM